MEVTIFEKILAGEIPCDSVFENDDVLAFKDINPTAPVHVLVIPKTKTKRFSQLKNQSPEKTGKFFNAVSKAASSLGLDGPGYRIVINCGKNGGQDVEYLHAHILGGRPLNWPAG